MANPVYGSVLEGLTFEERMQQLPEYPTRPMLFESDYPSGELATEAQAKFQMERGEREYQLRQAQSGYLAQPYATCGALTPQEQALELERQEDVRRYRNGLPDAPDEAPRVGSGKPY